MEYFEIALLAATLLCSLVAGFVFAFAIVVMPGIKKMKDGDFIRAFQVMDGVIQNNQPVFILVWMGSAITLIVAAGIGVFQLTGLDRVLLIAVAAAYLLAVQLPTMTINIPLNNKLQAHDVAAMNKDGMRLAREEFESKWNLWNNTRTVVAIVVSATLMFLLARI